MKMKKIAAISFVLSLTINLFSQISNVWVNNGEDKVTQDDLRAHNGANVNNSVWDGSKVLLFGGQNEVLGFNIILESFAGAGNISIMLDSLHAVDGSSIHSKNAAAADLFDWNDRQIELFYVRYLEIKGLSALSYENYYDERHVPERLRRPHINGYANAGTLWTDRPDHNKFYPEIAVPLELNPNFSIAAGSNQSIWVDVYIPKTASNLVYTGNIIIKENNVTVSQIPVELRVCNFELPDVPNAKTMLFLGYSDICNRYTGVEYPNSGSIEDSTSNLIRNRHFQMAHRHKISLIDENTDGSNSTADQPKAYWLPALSGTLFSHAQGYDGPGVGVGNGIFSIGTYGSWTSAGGIMTQPAAAIYSHTNNWVNWFTANSPATNYFLYLIDESTNYTQTATWCSTIAGNPGTGSQLPIFATIPLPQSQLNTPSLNIAASWFSVGRTQEWEAAAAVQRAAPGKNFFLYNGHRPACGSFATEDDGVALRVLEWAQFKKKIDRWFFWQSTYYNNFQGGTGQTDVFNEAKTFGAQGVYDNIEGDKGWNCSNGDGVLFYPGTDKVFPASSYDISGPIVSLRLKHWRRGIQDVDYLTMASAIDSAGTQNIVDSIIPKILWEYGCADNNDPTWVRTDISWSTNPDVWENARHQLAVIIGGCDVGNTINNEINSNHNKCYPNPTKGTFTLEFANPNKKPAVICIFNITGQIIFETTSTNEKYVFDGKELIGGVYTIRIKTDKEIIVKKLIKL